MAFSYDGMKRFHSKLTICLQQQKQAFLFQANCGQFDMQFVSRKESFVHLKEEDSVDNSENPPHVHLICF